MMILVVAAWICEDTVIEAYGFYHYNPDWHAFIGHVPLLIVLIWPVVVHSAWDLARALSPRPGWVPAVAALFVLADASLIEPIAVEAGLWTWTEPGLFGVPPVGILGWAFFALAAVHCLERRRTRTLVLEALVFSHAALLASWWALFRWVNQPLDATGCAFAAWALSFTVTTLFLVRRFRRRVDPLELWIRAPAAGFFFVLLLHADAEKSLLAYALAFIPPYLALLSWPRRHTLTRSQSHDDILADGFDFPEIAVSSRGVGKH
jgi:hypothetical protein